MRRAVAAPLLLGAGLQQSIDISFPPGPQQQTRRSDMQRSIGGTERQTDGQTDGRTMYRYIDPAPHTMRATPIGHHGKGA